VTRHKRAIDGPVLPLSHPVFFSNPEETGLHGGQRTIHLTALQPPARRTLRHPLSQSDSGPAKERDEMGDLDSKDGVSMKREIYLSVVIRARNEAGSLRQVLEALAAQRCSFKWEIIVVDNESEDETLELCKQHKIRVISIQRDEFTYGRALNLGIGNARGELVLLCSAHSVPVGSYFLESSVAPFADPKIAAVRCLVSSYHEQTAAWYKARDIQYRSLEEQETAESSLQWLVDYPAASCCVIRRSVWEQIPYDEHLEAVEDKLWASKVLTKGFKIRSCAEAVFVYNSRRGKIDSWKKINLQYRALYRTRGYVPLSWLHFLARVVRAALLAPLVAIRYFVETVVSNAYLVTIPWQAKFLPQAGSLSEFDKPIVKWYVWNSRRSRHKRQS
jgi:rhamnosyltransferase